MRTQCRTGLPVRTMLAYMLLPARDPRIWSARYGWPAGATENTAPPELGRPADRYGAICAAPIRSTAFRPMSVTGRSLHAGTRLPGGRAEWLQTPPARRGPLWPRSRFRLPRNGKPETAEFVREHDA